MSTADFSFILRPVCWLGTQPPGASPAMEHAINHRRLVYPEQAAGEAEAQYDVRGSRYITRVSSNLSGALMYFYGTKGEALDPRHMSVTVDAERAAITENWHTALQQGQVR